MFYESYTIIWSFPYISNPFGMNILHKYVLKNRKQLR